MRAPMLVSVPHGGGRVPDELSAIWALSEKDAFHDGDPVTSRIYDFADRVSVQLVMDYYRAVVDLNREPDDIAPANPDGVVKSHTDHAVPVYLPGREPDAGLVERLLEAYHRPYHRALESFARTSGVKLALDCHSMEPEPPPVVSVLLAGMILSVTLRVFLPLVDQAHYLLWVTLSGVAWILTFALFLWIFAPMMVRPRPDAAAD